MPIPRPHGIRKPDLTLTEKASQALKTTQPLTSSPLSLLPPPMTSLHQPHAALPPANRENRRGRGGKGREGSGRARAACLVEWIPQAGGSQ